MRCTGQGKTQAQACEASIHPLDSAHDPAEGITNIVSGSISPQEVGVDEDL